MSGSIGAEALSRRPVGAAGLALIKEFEGCRLKAYKALPTEKYWTIGWGHYGLDVKEGQTITQAEADNLLVVDCQTFADMVDSKANVPLTEQLNANQRDALISFAFNCGSANLRKLCRNRSLPQIRDAMALYNKSGGKTIQGLVRRRAAEQALWDKPVPVLDNTPTPAHREGVAWCVEKEILRGDGAGDLMLHQPVTTEKVCTMLYRALGER